MTPKRGVRAQRLLTRHLLPSTETNPALLDGAVLVNTEKMTGLGLGSGLCTQIHRHRGIKGQVRGGLKPTEHAQAIPQVA